MIKKITTTILLSGTLFASQQTSTDNNISTKITSERYKNVIDFSKNILKKFENNTFHVSDVKILNTAKIKDADNFTGYVVEFEIENGFEKKKLTDLFFVEDNDNIIVTQMYSFDGKNMTQNVQFENLGDSFYKKNRLSFNTNSTAKTKVAVFIDIFCPYCRANFKKLEDKVKDRKDIGVYLFSYPLDIHPSSIYFMAMLKEIRDRTGKDYLPMMMTADINPSLSGTRDIKKIAEEIEKITGETPKVESIEKYIEEVREDKRQGRMINVSATPSMFINGKRKELKDIKKREEAN